MALEGRRMAQSFFRPSKKTPQSRKNTKKVAKAA
jgi:hypothetical protein